ncbi:MAG: flap endonuclease [Actinomycetia bacterium]|nr:flap endonuclease [Actinomycetes bacterium]MCP4223814.1 flap endonuclease [Actinomycetes bacterium]MCP5031660.1 flap endonuclease [Actinomycetes bacterium]
MLVHVVDGTYELFRQYYARPSHQNADGLEVAGARAVVRGMVSMLEEGVTHIGVATDHVIRSFRNDLYHGYKDGSDLDPEILNQFGPLERGLQAIGIATFPMVEFEADDGMASMAAVAVADDRVDKVLLCTPDKDLAQCVRQSRVIQFDRRNNKMLDVADVIEKYGVRPESIPDYLGLVGDSADGFPGLSGWGAKSTAAVLTRYGHIEKIPLAAGQWDITVRGGAKLAKTLAAHLEEALLYRHLAVLDHNAPTITSVDELRWTGPSDDLEAVVSLLDVADLRSRTAALAEVRG